MSADRPQPLLRLPRELRDEIRLQLMTTICQTDDIHAVVISKDCLGISGANRQLRAEYIEVYGCQSLANAQDIIFPVHDFDFRHLKRFLEQSPALDDGQQRVLSVLITLSTQMQDWQYPDYGPWKNRENIKAIEPPARVSMRYCFTTPTTELLPPVSNDLTSWMWLWWQQEWWRKDCEPSKELVRMMFAYLNRIGVAQGHQAICCERSLEDGDWSTGCRRASCYCQSLWPPL